MTIQEFKTQSQKTLKDAFSKNSLLKEQLSTINLDIDILLSHFTGKDKTWILFHREEQLDSAIENLLQKAIQDRSKGIPVAYITNQKEFYGYNFYVSPDVLIPKPDTELLVDLALNNLAQQYAGLEKENSGLSRIPSVLDMCTGSGCVGLSILRSLIDVDSLTENELPKFTFADISKKALNVAKKNAVLLSAPENSIRFVQSNLFDFVPWTFDLIVTNPPYVPHSQSIELLKDGRNEPLLALDGDVTETGDFADTDDGLSLIRRLIPQCYSHLTPGGTLIMETGEYNAEETACLFKACGFTKVRIEKDLSDQLRDVIGEKLLF